MNEAIIKKATGNNVRVKLINSPLKLVILSLYLIKTLRQSNKKI